MTSSPGPDRRRWVVLAVLCIGTVMSTMDVFIVNVAIPSLRSQLHALPGESELVVNVYGATFGTLLITGGRLGDRFGRSRMFLLGMGFFCAASAACAIAPNVTVLICSRAVQAVGAAAMVPQGYATVQRVFDPVERVRAISFLTIGGSAGTVIGQVLGGALVQANIAGLGWRVVFLVNLPIGVVGLVAGARALPRDSPVPSSMDPGGVVLGSVSLLFLIVPLSEGRDLGWPVWAIGMLAAAPASFVAFYAFERRRSRSGRFALVEMSLFDERAFRVGVVLSGMSLMTNGGLFFVLTQYLQSGRGLSPGLSGLAFAPLCVCYMTVALVSPRVAGRFGRAAITAGFLTVSAGLGSAILVLHLVGTSGPAFCVVPSVGLVGVGLGLVNAPLFGTALSRTRRGQEGAASGVLTTMQQAGSALGVALEGLIFFAALHAPGHATHFNPQAATSAFGVALWANFAFDMTAAVLVFFLPPYHAVRGSPEAEAQGPGPTAALVPAGADGV